MKFSKIILTFSLLTIFLIHNQVFSQSKSREALGNALVTSIKNKDLEGFKALVFPDKLSAQHEENFWEMVNLNESHKIDWSNMDFVVLYKYESKDPEYSPYLIHSRLSSSAYKHFYFGGVLYKGGWFLEDKMELTQDEKYAPRD